MSLRLTKVDPYFCLFTKYKMTTVSFYKIPVYVCDSTKEYYLFDILLPSTFTEQTNIMILSYLCKLRPVFSTQKNIDAVLSAWLDSQHYIMFNYLYIPETGEQERLSIDGLKKIKIGSRVFSLSQQENSDFYFHSIVCMLIMQHYTVTF